MAGQESAESNQAAGTLAVPPSHQAYARGRRVIVSARGVTREYRVGGEVVRALKGIDLDIYAGEYLSIMGPSGSGKSTLFNMVGGLDTPTQGSVVVAGVTLANLTRVEQARLRNKCIGYIFQSYNIIPVMTAIQNVALPMLLGGMDVASANMKAEQLLEAVGLGERGHHRPDQLSGGQQQRVAIARAFANDPAIILADEPTGNLDTRTGEQIIEYLSGLSRKRGVTIISATHDHKMLAVSDRVVTIRDGAIDKIELRSELNIKIGSIGGGAPGGADAQPGGEK
ncbi:MAG: ABC transporter ATP-binding protein [Planctomycetes bacterium]|nr:ABC transporter ATP-binding protein [Planctomycetota bacterium]